VASEQVEAVVHRLLLSDHTRLEINREFASEGQFEIKPSQVRQFAGILAPRMTHAQRRRTRAGKVMMHMLFFVVEIASGQSKRQTQGINQ
jgi:predicted acyltransferase